MQIILRFYEELNDFLPPDKRKHAFEYELKEPASVKDIIESVGIPHTEVDLILVNSRSVDFNYLIAHGDQISVYPVFEALDITPLVHLRPEPLRQTRFILDTHLGRLAAYLRMLGFDTLYRNDYDDQALAAISVSEKRILLTCDRRLLMRKIITHGYFVRSRQPREQLLEIIKRFDLYDVVHPFTRCIHCNSLIHKVAKEEVISQLQPRTRKYYMDFWQCPACKKIYWQGSHYQRMQKLIKLIELSRPDKPDV